MPEVYLPDDKVNEVLDKLSQEYPTLLTAGTTFVTVYHEPPFTGQLPDGSVGVAGAPVIQFLVVSPHPRPLQKKHGLKHVTTGTVWESDWLKANQEYTNGHYVHVTARDPLEVIYRGLVRKHIDDYISLSQITN